MKPAQPKRTQVVRHVEDIPLFANEAEEDAFWATHVMGEELFDAVEPLSEEEQQLLDRARQERATPAARQELP